MLQLLLRLPGSCANECRAGLLQCSSYLPQKGEDNNWSNVEGGHGCTNAPVHLLRFDQLEQYRPIQEPKSSRARTTALFANCRHTGLLKPKTYCASVRLSDDTFVVAQTDGSPLEAEQHTHEWVRLIGNTTLPRIRFHDLRHSRATHLLANEVHPKVASERLGYSKVGMTLDLYSQVLPGMQVEMLPRNWTQCCGAAQRKNLP